MAITYITYNLPLQKQWNYILTSYIQDMWYSSYHA